MSSLDQVRAVTSARLNPRPVPWRARAISYGSMALFVSLIPLSLFAHSLIAWSVGLVYIAYDTALVLFVAVKTRPLGRPAPSPDAPAHRPTLGVIIAARNEAPVLAATIDALAAQADPPELILLADDGSDDGSAVVLARVYGLTPPPLGGIGDPSPLLPALRWLRLRHGGKARALNAAIPHVDTEVMLTVDADTLLAENALAAMRGAFAREPALVAATGVLRPICGHDWKGRIFQFFQRYEYVRNFLSRYAWMREDGLLLVSGAFAGFRTAAVKEVGGFDPECLVEDYELIHRLRRFSADHGRSWTVRVLGDARASTDSPGAVLPFLRQRRRWFGGFLQTQGWNRDMVGDPRFGRLGTRMLPVKAMDTLQPVYGLAAFAILLSFAAAGRLAIAGPVLAVMLGKAALDLAWLLWSLRLYRRWTGDAPPALPAVFAAFVEPFSFQLLRHLGALLGWVTVLRGDQRWGAQRRDGITDRLSASG